MTLFSEDDRRVFQRTETETVTLEDGSQVVEEEFVDVFQYRLNAIQAAERLDVLGYTAERARAEFAAGMTAILDDFKRDGHVYGLPGIEDDEQEDFLTNYTYDRWGKAFGDILTDGFRYPYEREKQLGYRPEIRLILDDDYWDSDFFHGFPRTSVRSLMRAILDVTDECGDVIMDFSDLVAGGYYTGEEKLADSAKQGVRAEFVSTAKIIVLTEGSTDAEFLRKSLARLHPNLAPLYSFLDFAQPNIGGGAGNLVHVVKGFIGSGVVNRVIAFFDNDTAATDALRALKDVDIPASMVLLRYPDIPLAESYPTIGPGGKSNLNVNRLAGSIEMYFGSDVLTKDDGELVPVQWKGYNQTLRQYQGELLDKSRLQDRFREKLAAADSHEFDWSGVEQILRHMFNAFQDNSSM